MIKIEKFENNKIFQNCYTHQENGYTTHKSVIMWKFATKAVLHNYFHGLLTRTKNGS